VAPGRSTWLVAGGVLAAVLLVAVGVLAGRATAPTASRVTATPNTVAPSPAPSRASAQPSPTSQPSDPGASVVGAPGQNVLAATGTGEQTVRFTAQRPHWTLATTSECPAADDFVVTALRGGQLVATVQRTGGAGSVLVEPPGDYSLAVHGTCRWSLRATS
jgi:hypothetical protein